MSERNTRSGAGRPPWAGRATSTANAAVADPFQLSRWALTGIVGCVVAALLPVFMTGALAVQVSAELHFGAAVLGIAVSMCFCVAAATSVPLGRAAERFGAAVVLRWAGIGSAVCLLGIAVAARTLGVLVALLTLSGAAVAAAQPAASSLIAHYATRARQGALLGVKQASAALAMLGGGIAVPALAVTVGWRWGYVAASVVALVATALVPRAPRTATDVAASTLRLVARPLVVLAVGFGFGTAATNTLGTFVVKGAVEAHLGQTAAGFLLMGGSAGAALVYVLAGVAADARPGQELVATAWMLGTGAISLCMLATSQSVMFVLAAPVAFALGSGWPGLLNLAVIRAHPSVPGMATGTTQTGAYLGAVIGPPAFGIVAEHISYGWAWFGAGVCSAVAAVVVLIALRMMAATIA